MLRELVPSNSQDKKFPAAVVVSEKTQQSIAIKIIGKRPIWAQCDYTVFVLVCPLRALPLALGWSRYRETLSGTVWISNELRYCTAPRISGNVINLIVIRAE